MSNAAAARFYKAASLFFTKTSCRFYDRESRGIQDYVCLIQAFRFYIIKKANMRNMNSQFCLSFGMSYDRFTAMHLHCR